MDDKRIILSGASRAADGLWVSGSEFKSLVESAPPARETSPIETPQLNVEVCRSFSYKLNLQNYGGPAYESVDFFASRKCSAPAESQAMVSEVLFEDCFAEVKQAKDDFITAMQARRARKTA